MVDSGDSEPVFRWVEIKVYDASGRAVGFLVPDYALPYIIRYTDSGCDLRTQIVPAHGWRESLVSGSD